MLEHYIVPNTQTFQPLIEALQPNSVRRWPPLPSSLNVDLNFVCTYRIQVMRGAETGVRIEILQYAPHPANQNLFGTVMKSRDYVRNDLKFVLTVDYARTFFLGRAI